MCIEYFAFNSVLYVFLMLIFLNYNLQYVTLSLLSNNFVNLFCYYLRHRAEVLPGKYVFV